MNHCNVFEGVLSNKPFYPGHKPKSSVSYVIQSLAIAASSLQAASLGLSHSLIKNWPITSIAERSIFTTKPRTEGGI
jgi:hypothetical protein